MPFIPKLRHEISDAAAVERKAPCLQLIVPWFVLQIKPGGEQCKREECNDLRTSAVAFRCVVHVVQGQRAKTA